LSEKLKAIRQTLEAEFNEAEQAYKAIKAAQDKRRAEMDKEIDLFNKTMAREEARLCEEAKDLIYKYQKRKERRKFFFCWLLGTEDLDKKIDRAEKNLEDQINLLIKRQNDKVAARDALKEESTRIIEKAKKKRKQQQEKIQYAVEKATQDYQTNAEYKLKIAGHLGKIAALSLAGSMQQDITTAYRAADNAIENNAFVTSAIIWGIRAYIAYHWIKKAQKSYQIYQEEGGEACAEYVSGEIIEELLWMAAFAGAGKAVKHGAKVGKNLGKSAKQAVKNILGKAGFGKIKPLGKLIVKEEGKQTAKVLTPKALKNGILDVAKRKIGKQGAKRTISNTIKAGKQYSKKVSINSGKNVMKTLKNSKKQLVPASKAPILKQAEQKLLQQAERNTIKQAERKLLQQTEKNAIKHTERKLLQQTEKKAIKHTERNLLQQTEKKAIKHTERNLLQQTEKKAIKRTERNLLQQTEKKAIKETERNLLQQTEKKILNHTGRTVLQQAEREILNHTGQTVLQQAEKEILKQVERELLEQAERKILKQQKVAFIKRFKDKKLLIRIQLPQKHIKETIKNTGQKVTSQIWENLGKEGSLKLLKNLAGKTKEALTKLKEIKVLKVFKDIKGKEKEIFKTRNKNGWGMNILKNGKKYLIRLMNKGSGQREVPYFRISINEKGAFNVLGKLCGDKKLTHIDINPATVVEDILAIVKII
ncbi:MAG: hypothetical protein AAF380_03205, partial [Bacteroidota bacterium]